MSRRKKLFWLKAVVVLLISNAFGYTLDVTCVIYRPDGVFVQVPNTKDPNTVLVTKWPLDKWFVEKIAKNWCNGMTLTDFNSYAKVYVPKGTPLCWLCKSTVVARKGTYHLFTDCPYLCDYYCAPLSKACAPRWKCCIACASRKI